MNDCHDCHVKEGEYHIEGCDWERCPKCGGQYISCGCDDAETYGLDRIRYGNEKPKATLNVSFSSKEKLDIGATGKLYMTTPDSPRQEIAMIITGKHRDSVDNESFIYDAESIESPDIGWVILSQV